MDSLYTRSGHVLIFHDQVGPTSIELYACAILFFNYFGSTSFMVMHNCITPLTVRDPPSGFGITFSVGIPLLNSGSPFSVWDLFSNFGIPFFGSGSPFSIRDPLSRFGIPPSRFLSLGPPLRFGIPFLRSGSPFSVRDPSKRMMRWSDERNHCEHVLHLANRASHFNWPHMTDLTSIASPGKQRIPGCSVRYPLSPTAGGLFMCSVHAVLTSSHLCCP